MIFINFSLVLYADEKQSIINRLVNIDNITFDFEQITNEKKEVGKCILVFDNKLNCDYEDSAQKRILTNGKTLIIQQKRYDKIYFYPIKNSPFVKILNKGSLINLIKESDYQLKNNIELTYFDRNKKKIIIFFETDSYDLVGWSVTDQLHNLINFSINIKYVNSEINPKIFKIPSID
jgi:outer membrane lipoprotein-sorting protein|tara:strand:- start:413 stop:943 length:531 start_codon:yes stop_codon:yes gene_type:complete